ncbi:hypothetical protein [Aestuariispira insulae]|uniref:Uncharacterized protein n=3 Tax=Aestuariispira insulae TaxID=1461337 RepID=A0A3D9H3R6_9PROT|nr:hypothetical protein [Aestuariispira insulae]RED44144.1 hypothetical protein DFP90_11748 [Aestuariispira insulae]
MNNYGRVRKLGDDIGVTLGGVEHCNSVEWWTDIAQKILAAAYCPQAFLKADLAHLDELLAKIPETNRVTRIGLESRRDDVIAEIEALETSK